MQLIVLTPEREIFQGKIVSLSVPGTGGRFEILKGHAPIVSSLQEGKVRIKEEGGNEKVFAIDKGFVEVLKDDISLLIRGFKDLEE